MSRLLSLALGWLWISLAPLPAHQPDTSYLTIRIGSSGIDAVFASDVTTLQRLFPELDADHDGAISRDEGEASRPVVESYLREHLLLDVDGQEANLGEPRPLGWPNPDLSPIPQAEWHQLLLQYSFHLATPTMPAELLVTCDVFIELGVTHKVICELQINHEVKHPVIFTLEEPDYRFYVKHALAKPPQGDTDPPSRTAANLIRRGLASTLRPATLLLLVALLAAVPPRKAGGLLGILAFGQLLAAVPITLLGSPLPARWLQLSQSLAVMLTAATNLSPRKLGPSSCAILVLVFGVIQGLAFGGITRESCLSPQRPIECLGSFQAGVGLGLLCAATVIASALHLIGTWHPRSILPRVISTATLVCGAGLLYSAFPLR